MGLSLVVWILKLIVVGRREGRMRKPSPVDARDGVAFSRWLGEMRELVTSLHASAVDAASGVRVYSRKELRRRITKVTRRLNDHFDAVAPRGVDGRPAIGPACIPPAANGASSHSSDSAHEAPAS